MLADDHNVMRKALCLLLGREKDFEIVGQTDSGREAVALAAALRPDVILLDLAMPDLDGAEATRRIITADPHARVLILSGHSEDLLVRRLVVAGAVGFLDKKSAAEDLVVALRTVATGRMYFSPVIAARLAEIKLPTHPVRRSELADKQLTPREKEVVRFIALGLANKQVAAELGISIKTVQKHRQHMMDKLNIHETAGLTRYAFTLGLI